MDSHDDRLLSPKEAAQRLSVSRWTIYSWLSSGRLKKIKLGRLARIPETEISRLIQEGEAL